MRRYFKENSWQIITLILGVLLIVSLFTNGFSSFNLGNNKEEIGNDVVDFINNELLQGQAVATLNSVTEENGLYKVNVNVAGQQIDTYVTKDGNLFFPQGVPLEDTTQTNDNQPTQGTGEVIRQDVDIESSPAEGSKDAKVTIVEYLDFQCPFCKRFFDQTLIQIRSKYVDTGKVKIVYKHFPLSFHPEAEPAALASECANEQGKFLEYHDLIFENQAQLSSSIYSTLAQQLKLDMNKFNDCFASKKYLNKVQDDYIEGQSKGISGTPGFLINGRLVSGAQPFSVFEQIIEEELGNRPITNTGNTIQPTGSAGGCGIPSGNTAVEPSQPSFVDGVSEDDDPFIGSENAPVVIVSFEDYQCPFCKRAFDQTFPSLKKDYINTGKVKYVYRDFPLSFHPYAQKAAEAAECAGDQEKYWEYHDLIFTNQAQLSDTIYSTWAQQLGLNVNTFDSCLSSGKYAQEVQKDFADGQKYGVSGTPTFFINGNKLVGAQPYSAFKSLIDQELNN